MIAARTVEQCREFLDPAVLEKADRLGTRGKGLLCVLPVLISVVPERVLAALERIHGQVELSRVRLPERGEFGQMTQDIRVGNSFGDLPVVGGVSAQ